ncbi:unnamed protein product [Mytilus coruscus]|uniref:Methyltransferase FkbM domain-containing protein n=1 Tax=Mytilus coruscus TaxID=42192 RepID=A0A6J8E047_MYTCO|nr:unnamed protein product [Mytilus coruscus]
MNVRPIVFVVVVVCCTVAGWIIGHHTLIRVDEESNQSENGQVVEKTSSVKQQKILKQGDNSIQNQTTSIKGGNSNQNQQSSVKGGITIQNQKSSVNNGNALMNIIVNNDKVINSIKNSEGMKTNKKPFLISAIKAKMQPTITTISNIQQAIRKAKPVVTDVNVNHDLKVYSHNGNDWISDNGICQTKDNFIKASLVNSWGYTPIYIHSPLDDKWVSGDLMKSGHWEGELVNLVSRLLNQDKDLQFVDLGANIGVFALSIAKLGRRVVAVEPLSINLQRLCKSVESGVSLDGKPFSDKITIIHNALSDMREKVELGKDFQNVGGTYVLKDSNEKKVQGSSVSGKYKDVVMTAKLDDILQLPNYDFKKVILKIDVEGYETKVFNGGQTFFDTVDVKAVLMEWRWHEGAHDLQQLLDFFLKRNYKAYNPKTNPLIQLQTQNAQRWPGDVLWQK